MWKVKFQTAIKIDPDAPYINAHQLGDVYNYTIYTDEDIYSLPSIPEWIQEETQHVVPNSEIFATILSCEQISGILIKANSANPED